MSECLYGVNLKRSYLDQKVEVLSHIMTGLDKELVHDYIARRVKNAQTESKREIQIDNVSKTIMMDYFNGDRSFCLKSKRKGKKSDG